MKKLDEIELHSEEINNVLKRPPSFLVKSGTFLLFMFLVILVASSFLIKYPETIDCNLLINKNNQSYTIESFNGSGEIVYCAFPNAETHITIKDTTLFIEQETTKKLYACITFPGIYEKKLKLRKELEIVVAKKTLDPELIYAKVSSIYRPFDSGDLVINVEILNTEKDFIKKTENTTIPAEILLDDETVFMRIFSNVKKIL